MKRLALIVLVVAGCGAQHHGVKGTAVVRCRPPSGSFAAVAPHGATVSRYPSGAVLARFGRVNANDYPTVFGVVGPTGCGRRWVHVQVPLRPNGVTGYVPAAAVVLVRVHTRIVVDVSSRMLTLYRDGRALVRATVAVGSPGTPTPIGRFYVNQRLVPDDKSGPFGPGAIGISAFSNVLTGWVQGGPVAIHGTNEPWSIGHAVSNGCIRLPNATLQQIWPLAVAGTPVIIRA